MAMRLPYDAPEAGPKRRLLLLAILVAAVAPRVVLALEAGIIEHDGAYYAGLASALLRGDWQHGLSTVWPPLYPGLIALASAPWAIFSGSPSPENLETIARWVSVIAGTLALVPLAMIARRALGARDAWMPIALAATHPRLIQYSASALTEATFMLGLLAALALLASSGTERTPATEGSAGAAFGLAYLARPEGLLLAAAVWLARLPERPPTSPRFPLALRLQPWFVLGFALAALPYLAWTSSRLGQPSLGEKGAYNLWREHREVYDARFGTPEGISERVFESPELAERAPRGRVELARFLIAEPGAIAARSLANLGRILTSSLPAAVYLPWLVPALIGLPLLARRELRPLAAVLVATPLIYAPFSVDRRFFVPLIPLLMIPAAAGARRLWGAATDRSHRGATILVAALCVYGLAYALWRPLMEDAPEHRAAGVWLRGAWTRIANSAGATTGLPEPDHGPVVVSRKTWVAFYAGGLIAELPADGMAELRERVRRKRADILVVDERWAVASRPWLRPLLDPSAAPAGTKVIWHTRNPRWLVLYDVRGWR